MIARLAPHLGYPTVNENKKREISDKFKADIIPILKEIPIYEDELFDLAEHTEECLSALEEYDKGDYNSGFALNIYKKWI